MIEDPIVEEIRRIREAHAARFNYDLDAIFRDIKAREKASGHRFVDGIARTVVSEATAAPVAEILPAPTVVYAVEAQPSA